MEESPTPTNKAEQQIAIAEKGSGAPDGGFQAWAVVAGGLINYCAPFGLLNSFGTFQTYYQNELLKQSTPSAISWIGSIQLFLLFIAGLGMGPAFDKFGARRLTVPGTLLYILSLMMTSLSTKYYQIFLAQGILFGIADAMVFYPAISAINMWFDKKRGIALGIVVSGSSIGDVIWPILIQYLLGSVGFAWAVRIVGFICLGLMIVSTALIVERRTENAHGGPVNRDSLKKELKSPTYVITTAAFTFSYLGMFIPFYYLPLYGQAHGMEPTLANYLLAILNGRSFCGRIISGYFADRVGVLNITVITSLLSSVTLLSLIAIKTQPSIIAFSALYGLFSGGLISLQAVSVARLTKDMDTYGTKIGIQMAVNSIGVLIGNPIGGALVQARNGEFDGLIIFSGVTLLFEERYNKTTAEVSSDQSQEVKRDTMPSASATFGTVNGSTMLRSCVSRAFGANATPRIVDPSDETYTDARIGEQIQFEHFPSVIAFAEKISEVPQLIKCAKKTGHRAVPRSGVTCNSKCFESWSALNDSLVIDISHIDYVHVSPDRTTATVGGGIRLGALYTALGGYNTTFNGGICPTVGLSGFLGSGGFTMQMRSQNGLGVDGVISAIVVTADGQIVQASKHINPDLFYAIRGGGGGTYGIVVEWTLSLVKYPRSAMVFMNWTDPAVQFDVSKRFLEWAPSAPAEFTTNINIYPGSLQLIGWYLGKSKEDLQELMKSSELLNIGKPETTIGGDCSTDNSRLLGYYIFDCVPDDQLSYVKSILNTVPQAFTKIQDYPQYSYNEVPKSQSVAVAPPWQRYRRQAKSFFVQKDKPLDAPTLRKVIDHIGQLTPESQGWAEWHAWNLSSTHTDSAFAWKEKALAHLEFQIHGSTDPKVQATYDKLFEDLERLLRPAVGPASYSGEMDAKISTEPLTSYYGDNVCKLIDIKKKWDHKDFFTNPFSIPTLPPAGIKCP
ncbi:uncharacterized protein GIQ15_03793 [Arthroderma uncinatum]|uniref:uncharacterized protein n=1 Tax=Arthroderma uncinatum TaxID=74035 RepID=UPI00144A8642|nr:uncharacterized protein GIQ15_03793 [Arthroderma uncinatum]KAF3481034.1 hypothetical protein GIQ15_03793 [Arthroderma uncinatum]